MEKNFTKRIAIMNIDTKLFPLELFFVMFDGVTKNKICSIDKSIFEDEIVVIVTFKTIENSLFIYQTFNCINIENTTYKFDMYIVPDEMVFDCIIETCTSSNNFDLEKFRKSLKNNSYNDELEESYSTEDFENDDSESEQNKNKDKNKNKDNEKKKLDTINLRERLESESEKKELENFIFNPNDPRFSKLYTDPDFCIDVSNKKYSLDLELNKVIIELRKNYK